MTTRAMRTTTSFFNVSKSLDIGTPQTTKNKEITKIDQMRRTFATNFDTGLSDLRTKKIEVDIGTLEREGMKGWHNLETDSGYDTHLNFFRKDFHLPNMDLSKSVNLEFDPTVSMMSDT